MSTRPRDKKEARLLELPLFREADSRAIRHLASAADEASVPAGQTLIQQGRRHHEGFLIERGTAVVEVDGEKIAEIPAGEMVGEMGFFVRGPASATVKAKTEMELLVIPYNRFDQILDDNPRLLRAIANELAVRLVATDALLH
jgi:CRP-like cAMP-binding protein